jgi:hypothetical protein
MNVLIQSAWWESKQVLLLVEAYHRRMMESFGWRYILDFGNKRGSPWRFSLVRAMLDEGAKRVVSMDCDSVITDALAFHRGPVMEDADLGMVPAGINLHAGTFYVNNTGGARAYLERCITASAGHDHSKFPEFFSQQVHNAKVVRLPRQWDEWDGCMGPTNEPTVVRSFHKKSMADKIAGMKKLLEVLDPHG